MADEDSKIPGQDNQANLNPVKKRKHRPRRRKKSVFTEQQGVQINSTEPSKKKNKSAVNIHAEPVVSAEAEVPEELYLSSQDNNQAHPEPKPEPKPPIIEPAEETAPPELPEELAHSEFHTGEPVTGPVGWDQLKEEIKKDYDDSGNKIPEAAPVVSEEVSEIPEVEEEKAEEVIPEPVKEKSFEPKSELAADEEAEKKEIMSIILKYAIGGCVVIFIIAGIFLFKLPQRIYDFAVNTFSGSGEPQVVEEIPTAMQQTEQTSNIDQFETGIGTAIVTGEHIPKVKKVSPAVQILYMTGLPEISQAEADFLASYLSVLVELQNAFTTDIHQLLDSSVNRQQTLDVHLKELQDSYAVASDTFEEMNLKGDELKVQFNQVTTEKTQLEKDFFVAMDKLEANKANMILNNYIAVSKQQVDLKAKYNAINKTIELYQTALKNMDARIKDIILNKDALIKGVKVVDIKGSDLKLIIQESEL